MTAINALTAGSGTLRKQLDIITLRMSRMTCEQDVNGQCLAPIRISKNHLPVYLSEELYFRIESDLEDEIWNVLDVVNDFYMDGIKEAILGDSRSL